MTRHGLTDPATRLKRATTETERLRAELVALAAVRAGAVRELREAGWSLSEIGDLIGVSRARVGQLEGR